MDPKREREMPVINWRALQSLAAPARPAPPAPGVGARENIWDRSADMYREMAAMERAFTLPQLDVLPVGPEDTVLDIGCGPGRIAVPMAQRARSVTAIDTSEKMLAHCRANAQAAGAKNLDARLLDWLEAVPGENLAVHDVAIGCRSVGLSDLEKLSAFARQTAVVIAFANAPSIPEILGELFDGATERPPFQPPAQDRRLGYNVMFNIVYDLGYEPNLRIFPDGFTADFPDREAAYARLLPLSPVPVTDLARFRANADRCLTQNPDGTVTFLRETRSFVMWWDTRR